MSTLFNRVWRVTVGTVRINKPMRVAFEIERSMRARPNAAKVRIWNLTREHQAQIEGARVAQVIVEAGYEDDRGLAQIFRGELFRARGNHQQSIRSAREGTDVVTYIEARDGGVAYGTARVAHSFDPGVRIATVLRTCADALGVGVGNIDDVADVAELEAGGDTYPEGLVLSGQASNELTRLLRGLDLRWSIQFGAIQITRRGEALSAQAVRLAPDSGLVGTPAVGNRGRITVRALLTPQLWPGRPVVLESDKVRGRYICRSVTFSGDSHGNDWLAECELASEAA